jgi:hypothetical protein
VRERGAPEGAEAPNLLQVSYEGVGGGGLVSSVVLFLKFVGESEEELVSPVVLF